MIGVPHERHGEEIKAVVLAPGAALSEDELTGWCKERMAGYKYPRLAEFLDVLPTDATGKILKRELQDTGRAAAPAAVAEARPADLLEAR